MTSWQYRLFLIRNGNQIRNMNTDFNHKDLVAIIVMILLFQHKADIYKIVQMMFILKKENKGIGLY